MYDEGNYKGCVEVLVFGLSGKKGTEQMEIRFYLDENTRKSAMLYFTPATEDQSMETLHALGFNGDFKAPAIAERYYKGYELEVYCKHEDYEGKPVERWNIGGGGGKPAPDDLAARRSAEFRARFGGNTAPPKKAPPASSPPKAPPAKSAPPPPAEKPYGKDEAWAELVGSLAEKGKEVDVKEWQRCIDQVGPDETEFGSDEWKQVVAEYLPF